jgi:hypothetical protein
MPSPIRGGGNGASQRLLRSVVVAVSDSNQRFDFQGVQIVRLFQQDFASDRRRCIDAPFLERLPGSEDAACWLVPGQIRVLSSGHSGWSTV